MTSFGSSGVCAMPPQASTAALGKVREKYLKEKILYKLLSQLASIFHHDHDHDHDHDVISYNKSFLCMCIGASH